MIITIEIPDDFHILNIGLVDANDKHSITRSFTKCELIEKDEYIEKSEFTSFPADVIDDTMDAKDAADEKFYSTDKVLYRQHEASNHEFSDAIAQTNLDILGY